jgi:hypothetical protein
MVYSVTLVGKVRWEDEATAGGVKFAIYTYQSGDKVFESCG